MLPVNKIRSSRKLGGLIALMLVTASNDVLGGSWELVWSDEFEGDRIDPDKWSHEVNCAGGGNNELQCYTAREVNSYVREGKLHIVARQEDWQGPVAFDDDPGYDPDRDLVSRNYTSARLRTKYRGDWRYGRIEVNARMPQGQGIWPAIWMLPTYNVYGSWPLSGEIDIFEGINLNASHGNQIHGTLHFGGRAPANRHSSAPYTPSKPVWEYFQTYAIEWERGEIRWYVDETHYATQTQAGWFTHYQEEGETSLRIGEGASPFDQAFHLLLNIAVGGNWPGPPNTETDFPQQMVVDFVRVYQCTEDPETGTGCATVNPSVIALPGVPGP